MLRTNFGITLGGVVVALSVDARSLLLSLGNLLGIVVSCLAPIDSRN